MYGVGVIAPIYFAPTHEDVQGRLPPSGLGDYFPLSANSKTPSDGPFQLVIKIDTQRQAGCNAYLSGQVIEGRVEVQHRAAGASEKPVTLPSARLSLSAFHEARVMYWDYEGTAQKRTVGQVKLDTEQGHEWHRFPISDAELQSGPITLSPLPPYESDKSHSATFPFRFTLPTRVAVTEYNKIPYNEPRDRPQLIALRRAPPPTMRGQRDCSLESVIQVVLTLDTGSVEKPRVDPVGWISSTSNVMVARTVFPTLPCDEHCEADLTSLPTFAPDTIGERFATPAVQDAKIATQIDGYQGPTTAFISHAPLKSKLGRSTGSLRSYTLLPAHLKIARSTRSIRAAIELSLDNDAGGFLSAKSKPITITKAKIRLISRVSTRGGIDPRPKTRTDEQRLLVCPLSLVVEPGKTTSCQLDVDLQGEGGNPTANLPPSAKTPCWEVDYALSIALTIADSDVILQAFRGPLQLLPGVSLQEARGDLPSYQA